MKLNRIVQIADGGSAGITLKAKIMGVNVRGLGDPLVLTNLEEVRE